MLSRFKRNFPKNDLRSCFFIACNNGKSSADAASTANPPELTTIQWIDSVKNYGKINEGQKLAIAFRFRNSGAKPLVITSVIPGCGCTVADYPKEPIAPGAEGEITGSFDSHGREGLQHKEITVTANTKGSTVQSLHFEVEVAGKKETNPPRQ